jgi:ABC-type multidrug transport system fused ATPase/permease subunit
MKKQISRISPHQNGKVFGILMAVASLVFVVPMLAIMMFSVPAVDQHGNPATFPKFLIILFPILYLVIGYLTAVIGSAIYNFFFRYIGGFEFEVKDENA